MSQLEAFSRRSQRPKSDSTSLNRLSKLANAQSPVCKQTNLYVVDRDWIRITETKVAHN